MIRPDGNTKFIKILAGVLQRDISASYLFGNVFDYAMGQTLSGKEEEQVPYLIKRRIRHNNIIITETDFVDDMALISEQISQVQEMQTRVETETQKKGLFIHKKKTETMRFN